MPLPALAIPVIMTGARAVTRVAAKEAAKLIAAGKARYAKNVVKDIEKAITQIRGKGKGAPKMPPLASTTRKKAAAAAKKKAAAAAAAKKKAAATKIKRPGTALVPTTGRSLVPIGKATVRKRKIPSGLKAAGVIAGTVGVASLLDPYTGGTKSVTVKAGDTLSQIAKDNNTTLAAIKKANPSITNIHRITPGQTIKVPKVKDRKSVYQGMTTAELQQPKKTTTTASKIKYGPGGYGASKSGGIVKRKSGGTVKKYAEGKMIGSKRLPRPTIKKPWGAAIKGRGKGYKS